MTNNELWQTALGEIELSISKANFVTWFKNTTILSKEDGRVVIGVPNGFAKEWLENKYNTYIIKALQSSQDDIREISCTIYNILEKTDAVSQDIDAAKAPSQIKTAYPMVGNAILKENPANEANLNPRYTFDNFVVGENNELARAACYAVSQNLGNAYNPLFIYGGVGLGKTHLLQSLGNEVIKKNPEKEIKYITSERFTSELIDAIRSQRIDKFKNDYQKIDLLIIDDIQFLSGKEKTQHEFFHIFNALYQINKQIVLSSDRPPKAIPTIEERLRSRFEGGMIADIGQPDLETRMAILRTKMAEKGFYLEDDVIKFVAENIKSNVRELEGALNRIIASCELNKRSPSIKNVGQTLSELISSGKRKGIHHKHIIKAVANFYEISDRDIINKGRRKEIVRPRQVAMYLMRIELNASYPGIGGWLGGRDHTTALHAYEKINRELEVDEKLKEDLVIIKDKLYSL
ncbi:MAG TPA: chromosomal replication initiator protein DnaA [Candidatus Pacearchaeota archaeon]|nr:chromosomal replication initiator protein DnaA [Candidatus Pacearchaeota archaeon]